MVLASSQLLAVTAMSVVLPFIPFFIRELGVSERAAVERWSGLIFSGPFLTAALFSPVWGHFGDKYGYKLMVVRAVFGLALANVFFAFVRTPLQFYVMRIVQGAFSGFIPAAIVITTAGTPAPRLPDALGKLYATSSAGRLIGPVLGGFLAGFLAFRGIFLVVAAMMAVAGFVVIGFLREPPRVAADEERSARASFRAVIADVHVLLALAGLLVVMVSISMVMPVFPLYVEDLLGGKGDAPFLTGVGFATVAGFTLLTSSFLGHLSERLGLKVLLLAALGCTTVALALHALAASIAGMLVARALLGIGTAGVQPALFTMIGRRAPEGQRGGVTGYASSATILGFFIGPLSGGWLANSVGVTGVFLIAASVALASGLGAAIIAQRLGRGRSLETVTLDTPR